MFQLSGITEIANVDCESDSTNEVCVMNVSTVSATMDIRIDEAMKVTINKYFVYL